jgi:hypothetical protein
VFKIKSLAIANPDFDKSYIFDRFSSRRFFHVGDHFCEKKLKILDFLTFEGIIQCLGLLGFGCISMSKFQWYAWGVLKINIFLGI